MFARATIPLTVFTDHVRDAYNNVMVQHDDATDNARRATNDRLYFSNENRERILRGFRRGCTSCTSSNRFKSGINETADVGDSRSNDQSFDRLIYCRTMFSLKSVSGNDRVNSPLSLSLSHWLFHHYFSPRSSSSSVVLLFLFLFPPISLPPSPSHRWLLVATPDFPPPSSLSLSYVATYNKTNQGNSARRAPCRKKNREGEGEEGGREGGPAAAIRRKTQSRRRALTEERGARKEGGMRERTHRRKG